MIGIEKFTKAVNDRLVTGTSGYDDTLIEKVNQAQGQLMNVLAAQWEKNQAVKDMIDFFVQDFTISTISGTGLLPKPDDYVHLSAIFSANDTTAYPINNNEVSTIKTSPIRKPDVSKGLVFYYQKKNALYFLPDTISLSVKGTYIRKPQDAALTYTPVSEEDNDYLVASDPTDLEWPETAFDLLLYMTLERFGMEVKDPLIIEYAKIGITTEMINVDPQ